MREEVDKYRIIVGNKTCVFEKENDPTLLRSPSAGIVNDPTLLRSPSAGTVNGPVILRWPYRTVDDPTLLRAVKGVMVRMDFVGRES